MTIWIIALIVIGLFVAIGYFQGGISAAVTLLGIILASFLALPLAPLVKPIFPGIGLTSNTVWLWLWPPVLVFTLLVLIFLGLGFGAQRPVSLHYKYKTDDLNRHHYERLSGRVGACVGVFNGLICVLMIGVAIYVPGYFTVQFANESDPAWLRYLNQARNDMAATGLDKLARPLDPAPKNFYPVADMLGFIYQNNPAVIGRLADYPPFLSLGERQEFKDIAGDKELMESLQGKASLADLITNPKILAIINNAELSQELLKLDLQDMMAFIKTGKSAKYDSIKILGRWELDADEVIMQAKRSRPDIKATELAALRRMLATMSSGTTFKATTDNKAELVTKGMIIDMAKLAELRAAAQTAAAPPPQRPRSLGPMTSMPANLRARYFPNQPQPPPTPPPDAAPAQPATPMTMQSKTMEGTWDGEGDNYQLKIRDDKGREETTVATIEGDELLFTIFGQPFVFMRQM